MRARFQNVYGPGEVLGAGRWRGTPATVWRNVTPTFVYRALKGLPLRARERRRRDAATSSTSSDIARGPDRVRGRAARRATSTTSRAASRRRSASSPSRSSRCAASGSELEVAPPRDWDRSGQRFGSTDKSERELGFVAQTPLDDGLTRTIAWIRAELPLVDACIARHADRLAAFAA